MGLRPLPHVGERNADLALDMYEHSYHIDFGAKAAGYVETFMAAIRWGNAARLLDELEGKRGGGRNGQ